MTGGYSAKQNMISGIQGGTARPANEHSPRSTGDVPPTGRKRNYLILGVVLVCFLAVAAYFIRRAPARPGDATITATDITPTSATIAWTTSQPLTSQVEYGTTPAYGSLSVFGSSPVTSHSVNLTGLTPGTTYNYAALSTDSAGQVSTSPNFIFTTPGTAATGGSAGSSGISRVTAGRITPDSATITWTTDQPVTAQVEYGPTTAYGSLSVFSATPSTSHSVVLTGLTPGTTYNYAALSTNANGQVSASGNFSFTTGGTSVTSGSAGSPVISRVSATGITTNSATIAWMTDQPLTSQVDYGPTTARGSLSGFKSEPVKSHSVTLTALAAGTTYNYAALSTDSAGRVSTSANFTFTTASVAGAPVIGNVTASGITTNSATITWTTDQPSASQVKFGTTTGFGSLSAYGSSLVTSHSMMLPGLTPGTTYDYAALSGNSAGQVGTSANFTFTTAAGPPVIKQVAVAGITGNSATITWTTDQPCTSQVRYGATTLLRSLLRRSRSYESSSTRDASLVTSHSVVLSGLNPGITYNYQTLSANSQGMENVSQNLKFTTLAGKAKTETVMPGSGVARTAAFSRLVDTAGAAGAGPARSRCADRIPRPRLECVPAMPLTMSTIVLAGVNHFGSMY